MFLFFFKEETGEITWRGRKKKNRVNDEVQVKDSPAPYHLNSTQHGSEPNTDSVNVSPQDMSSHSNLATSSANLETSGASLATSGSYLATSGSNLPPSSSNLPPSSSNLPSSGSNLATNTPMFAYPGLMLNQQGLDFSAAGNMSLFPESGGDVPPDVRNMMEMWRQEQYNIAALKSMKSENKVP